ncbi:DnaJ like protein, partial [Reticulomyxa filosa]
MIKKKKKGLDLFMKKKVRLIDALTSGYKFDMVTLDRRVLRVCCDGPRIIEPYSIKCIPNEGIPDPCHPKIRGHLFIQFEVVFPKIILPQLRSVINYPPNFLIFFFFFFFFLVITIDGYVDERESGRSLLNFIIIICCCYGAINVPRKVGRGHRNGSNDPKVARGETEFEWNERWNGQHNVQCIDMEFVSQWKETDVEMETAPTAMPMSIPMPSTSTSGMPMAMSAMDIEKETGKGRGKGIEIDAKMKATEEARRKRKKEEKQWMAATTATT